MNRVDKFLTFEADNDLFNKRILGIEYWPIVREMIYNDINSISEKIGRAHDYFNSKKLKGKIKDVVVFFRNVIKHKIYPIESREILILSHPRRIKNGLFYDCPYTDFLRNINRSYYIFEESCISEHLKPVRTNEIRYTDRINLRFYIEYLFMKLANRYKLKETDKKHIIDVIEKINKEFKIELDKNIYVKKTRNELIKFKLLYKYYKKIIMKINPKLIIEVISYERRRKVINSIAKEYGIPTIELQHGTIGKYEIAYNFLNKRRIHTFPDYLFLFGDFWRDNSRFPIDSNKVISVGWSYFEEKIKEYQDADSVKNNKTILFISQGTIGAELSKIAVELNALMKNSDYRIIYKLHQGEYIRWKTEYPWLIDSNIEVIDNSSKDMYYYYSQASIQIGVYSTAIFEGLGYGLKTIICKLYGYEYMEELYLNNYAKLVENAVEIVKYLNDERVNTKEVDRTYFWKSYSFESISELINNIIMQSKKDKN